MVGGKPNRQEMVSKILSHFCIPNKIWFPEVIPVSGAVCLSCGGLLVREACVGVLVGGAGFLPSGVSISEF